MAVPNIFANVTTSIPLSQLDANFATAITLGNTAVYLGNTTTTIGNLTLTNANVSSVSTPITPAQGGTGLATLTANNVLIGNGTSNVTFVAPGTSGNVLTSNGTVWSSSSAFGNGPAFSAYQSGTQTVSNNTTTKILFDTENFDTNNNFASSRFTPTVAGYYVFTNALSIGNFTNIGTNEFEQVLYKNGSSAGSGCVAYGQNSIFNVAAAAGHNIYFNNTFGPVYANGTTDYFEIYLTQNTGGSRTVNSTVTAFSGFMVRSA